MRRDISLRIELEADSDVGGHFLPDGVEVDIEVDLRSGFHQTAGAFREDVAVFAQSVFIEKCTLGWADIICSRIIVGIIFHRSNDVMNYSKSFCGPGLDRLEIAILLQTGIHVDV